MQAKSMGYLRQIPRAGTNASVILSPCSQTERRRNARLAFVSKEHKEKIVCRWSLSLQSQLLP